MEKNQVGASQIIAFYAVGNLTPMVQHWFLEDLKDDHRTCLHPAHMAVTVFFGKELICCGCSFIPLCRMERFSLWFYWSDGLRLYCSISLGDCHLHLSTWVSLAYVWAATLPSPIHVTVCSLVLQSPMWGTRTSGGIFHGSLCCSNWAALWYFPSELRENLSVLLETKRELWKGTGGLSSGN